MREVDAKQEQYNLVSEVMSSNQQPSDMRKKRFNRQQEKK